MQESCRLVTESLSLPKLSQKTAETHRSVRERTWPRSWEHLFVETVGLLEQTASVPEIPQHGAQRGEQKGRDFRYKLDTFKERRLKWDLSTWGFAKFRCSEAVRGVTVSWHTNSLAVEVLMSSTNSRGWWSRLQNLVAETEHTGGWRESTGVSISFFFFCFQREKFF
jgi:hypothetical protein